MKRVLLLALASSLVFGCAKYPADSVTTEENDLIVSLYDENADFKSYKTFAIVDSVVSIKRESGEPKPDTSVSRYSDRIINLLSDNMKARGYVRVHKDSAPDLGIDASILVDENQGSFTYWGGYPGYWGWYGWSYWYPYPVTSYYNFEIGSLIINMVDLKNRNEIDKELTVIWHNVAAGLVSQSSSYDKSRIDRAVEIMFEQSPYVSQ